MVILLTAFVRSKAKKKITVVSEMTNELEMDVQLPKDDNGKPLEVGACDWISCFLTHVGPIHFPLQVDKWLVIRLRPRPHKRVHFDAFWPSVDTNTLSVFTKNASI